MYVSEEKTRGPQKEAFPGSGLNARAGTFQRMPPHRVRAVNIRQTLAEVDQARREQGSRTLKQSSLEERKIPLKLEALRIDAETEHLLDSQIVQCGKYRGRTFAYASKDFYYARWVLNQRYVKGALGRFRTYLDENRNRLIEQQMQDAMAAEGTLSTRVRVWNRETMIDRGILLPVPSLGNATFHGSRRPRQPVASLELAGVLEPWNAKWTKVEKGRAKGMMAMSSRTLTYIFRWMLHLVRNEPIDERLVADKALQILGVNDYAYRTAMALTQGEMDGFITREALQETLQRKRASIKSASKLTRLPETFDLTRMGDMEQIRPRDILMRYTLSLGELRKALKLYRSFSKKDIATRWPDLVAACWTLARADGAFVRQRVCNLQCPTPLQDPGLRVIAYMRRAIDRWFKDAPRVTYAPCLGFSDGCPVEADLVVGDTVFAIRGSLWVSSSYDAAYLSGYAALARSQQDGGPGAQIDRTVLIFLQHETALELDLTDWDHQHLLVFLQAHNNAELKEEGGNACDLGLCEQDGEVPDALDIDEEQKEIEKHERTATATIKSKGHAAGVQRIYVPRAQTKTPKTA
jgi:hypothetical protein